MFESIDTVVFDLGGVLIDLYRDRCVEAFRRIGFPQAEQMLGLYHPADIFIRLESGQITTAEVCEYIRRKSGKPIPDEAIRKAYLAFIGTIPVAKLRAIRALREAGKRTFALSNTNEIVMPHIRERLFTADGLRMEDYFEKAYLSYEMTHPLHRRRAPQRRDGPRTGLPGLQARTRGGLHADAPRTDRLTLRPGRGRNNERGCLTI